MTVYVAPNEEKQTRMPIFLPDSQGSLEVCYFMQEKMFVFLLKVLISKGVG